MATQNSEPPAPAVEADGFDPHEFDDVDFSKEHWDAVGDWVKYLLLGNHISREGIWISTEHPKPADWDDDPWPTITDEQYAQLTR